MPRTILLNLMTTRKRLKNSGSNLARPPKTIKTIMAAVKEYLLENEVELPQLFWKKLR